MSDFPRIACDVEPHEPHYLAAPILVGAPSGYICRACGEPVGIDDDGLTLPHTRVDIMGMLGKAQPKEAREW